jgi:hypothetical protein
MFKNKYLKYKQKYLDLKVQIGGSELVNINESKSPRSGLVQVKGPIVSVDQALIASSSPEPKSNVEQALTASSTPKSSASANTIRGDISLPLHQKCEECYSKKSCPHTHQEFTFECTPYTDVTVGKYNIVNWDNNYIYYNQHNEPNTIRMTKSFEFIDVNRSELPKFKKPILNDYLNDYINYEIYRIPLYFMYTNTNNNIFNLFCYSCNIRELDNLQISYDTSNNRFVKFKSKFNIFSVSFLCNNFFDVIRLFLDEVDITTKLTELFKDFAIEKLYYQSIYKENFNVVKKNSEYLNYTFFSEERKDLILPNNYEIVDRKEVIEKLKKQIELYKRKFSILNKIIPNFDKIYIMSILHYRLIKSPNINSSWNFDTHYIYRNIRSSREYQHKYIFNIYIDDPLVLYDNTEEISFRNEKYRCCMENTLLQFLKVLLWNGDNKSYNLANITEIISDEFKDEIDDFFIRIDKELTQKFISEWVIFVTELSNNYHFNKKENKAELLPDIHNFITFLKKIIKKKYANNDNQIFLSNIIQKINSKYTIDYNTTNSVTTINIVTYKEFKIILTQQHAYFESAKTNANNIGVYNIGILRNIQKTERILSNYLYNNLELCLVDINSFIVFLSLSFEKLIEKQENLTKKQQKEKLEKEKQEEKESQERQKIINKYLGTINNKESIYRMFFHDGIRQNIHNDILLSLLDHQDVYSSWNIKNTSGDTMWHDITNIIRLESFWNKVIDKDLHASLDIQNTSGDTVWHNITNIIRLESFWNKVIDKGLHASLDIRNNNGDTVWHNIIRQITIESFWDKVIDKNLLNKSWDIPNNNGTTVWHYVVNHIESEIFWNKVIDKNLINESWDRPNNGTTLWHYAIRNIKLEIFWNKVINRGLCASWDRPNEYDRYIDDEYNGYNEDDIILNDGDTIWHFALQDIKWESFWNNVIDNDLCSSWYRPNNNGDTIWYVAFKNINFNSFWNKVIEKGLYASWDRPNNGKTLWYLAIRNIKSESFWNQVIDKNLCRVWDVFNKNDTMWHYAVKNITSESFWNKVIETGLYASWDRPNEYRSRDYGNSERNYGNSDRDYGNSERDYGNSDRDYGNSERDYDNRLITYSNRDETIMWKYGDTIWHYVVKNIKWESFWNQVIEKGLYGSWNIYNNDSDSVWYLAIINIKWESFWNQVIDNNLITISWEIRDNDGNTAWIPAVIYIKWESFWNKVIEKGLYSSWDRPNNDDDTVWDYAVRKIKWEIFWNKVIDKNLCRTWDKFNRNGDTMWHNAIKKIKWESFWNKVIDKDLCRTWNEANEHGDTIWHFAVRNITSESFWNKVIDNDLCGSWNEANENGDTVWDYADENIEFESFWNKVHEKGLH